MAVQPRVCGERELCVGRTGKSHGSAPRVRGTRLPPACVRTENRFSPACAGNARRVLWRRSQGSVQPRVCGEREPPHLRLPERVGSAPRVRGTHECLALIAIFERFSPACAGNALARTFQNLAHMVQPRVCGERRTIAGNAANVDGSAPRVRGTPLMPPSQRSFGRFSPACAGNAWPSSCDIVHVTVQPRVCGERRTANMTAGFRRGSAPRVRGTLFIPSLKLCDARFSPACAGNAHGAPAPSVMATVQPRVCGERFASNSIIVLAVGSAPRVRGTPRIVRV